MRVENGGVEFELVVDDARHVQEVVDEMRFEFDVAPDDFDGSADIGGVVQPLFQFGDHHDDRGERVAQFVGEQGEELVLGGVRADQFAAEG